MSGDLDKVSWTANEPLPQHH